MPTQLEVFQERLKRISGWTSDREVSAESYYNDVTILTDVINSIMNYTLETDCPWCDLADGKGHKDQCLLLPLFEQYKGYTHTLKRSDTRKGAWEEGERDEEFNGRVERAITRETRGPKATVHKPVSHPKGFKIWEVKETNKAMMEYKGSPENVARLRDRYEKGGWKEEMSFEMGAETTLVMSLSPRSALEPFLQEIRAEEAAAREALAATGGE